MSARDRIKSIHDLLKVAYSPKGGFNILRGMQGDILKDDPVISTTTGANNPIFGAQAFSQLNQEANAFGVIPKLAWTRSGWRIVSARAASVP